MLLFFAFMALWLPQTDDGPAAEQARQILTSAAVAQRGPTAIPRPTSLHGRFSVTARKQDGNGTFSVEVERFYLRAPERMLTRRTESLAGSDSSVGFDGKVFWMQDNRSGQVAIYSDDPETFHTDLALEREQLQLTRLILDVVSIDGLLQQLIEPRVLGRQTINVPSRRRNGEDREVDVIGARLPDVIFAPDLSAPPPLPGTPPALLEIQLFIDVESHFVQRIELSTIDREVREMWQLVLLRHAPNGDGLIVPSTIRILDGRGDPVATLGLIGDAAGLPVFELGVPLDAALFAVPGQAPADDEG